MQTDTLIAIDTHVHIEPDSRDTAADDAARKYFGETGPTFNRQELADYYRARKIGCVVFSVDERMTGRTQVPNEEVLALAKSNADVMIAFASVDPTRGKSPTRDPSTRKSSSSAARRSSRSSTLRHPPRTY